MNSSLMPSRTQAPCLPALRLYRGSKESTPVIAVFLHFFEQVSFKTMDQFKCLQFFFPLHKQYNYEFEATPKLCRIFFGKQKWIFSTHMHCYRNLNKFLHIFVFKKNHRTELYWCVCLKAISKSYRIVFVVSHHFDCMLSLILPRWCYTSCEP